MTEKPLGAATDGSDVVSACGSWHPALWPTAVAAVATRSATATALSSRYGFDFFGPGARPAILATLALAADPRSLLLVSSRHPLRIRRCVAQINWSIARGDTSDYVNKVGTFLTGDSAAAATAC